jgi:hypothetical protein
MPNYVYSRVEATGSKEDIKAVRDIIENVDANEGDRDSEINFNALYPTPQELKGVAKFFDNDPRSENERFVLTSKYGCDNAYDWQVSHWGTKWGLFSITVYEATDTSFSFFYQTAWSTALPFFEHLCTVYPSLSFKSEAVDEGDFFVVRESCDKDGSDSCDYKDNPAVRREICESVGCWNEEEDYEYSDEKEEKC